MSPVRCSKEQINIVITKQCQSWYITQLIYLYFHRDIFIFDFILFISSKYNKDEIQILKSSFYNITTFSTIIRHPNNQISGSTTRNFNLNKFRDIIEYSPKGLIFTEII